jgi:hypothetical protein
MLTMMPRDCACGPGVRILVDPWLVGELVFAGQRWLYAGKKTHIAPQDPAKVAEGADAIILSQVTHSWCSCMLPRSHGLGRDSCLPGQRAGVMHACTESRTTELP